MLRYVIGVLLVSSATAAAQSNPPARPSGEAAAAGQEKPATETKVDASRGGITISSGHNSLTLGARIQVRYTFDARESIDMDTAGEGAGREDDGLSQFDVPRARLTFRGGVYRPWLHYDLQLELGRTSGEGGSRIKDAFIDIRPVDRNYRIAVGQFKVPFGLQQMTSSGRLQFIDRAITDTKFTAGRDMGAMLAGTARSRTIGYEAGVFNGSGESTRQTNESHLWAARVFFHPLGTYSLAEGAIGAERPLLHAGGGIRGGKAARGRTPEDIVEDPDNQVAWNLEFAYRRPRFFTTAEFFWMTDEQENPAALADVHSRGYHAQAGYLVAPDIEIAALWASIEGDTDVDDAGVHELRGGVNYYVEGHNVKLQADIGRIGYGARYGSLPARARQGLPSLGPRLVTGEDLTDTQLRVQLQLGF